MKHTKGNKKLVIIYKDIEKLKIQNAKLLNACKEVISSLPPLWGDHEINGVVNVNLYSATIERLEQAIKKAES